MYEYDSTTAAKEMLYSHGFEDEPSRTGTFNDL